MSNQRLAITPREAAALHRLLDAYIVTETGDAGIGDLRSLHGKAGQLDKDHTLYEIALAPDAGQEATDTRPYGSDYAPAELPRGEPISAGARPIAHQPDAGHDLTGAPSAPQDGSAGQATGVTAILPLGTTSAEHWSVRWTWPTGETDGMGCDGLYGSSDPRTPRERAQAHASRHVGNGIAGEVLRRVVYTTPDETIERYAPDPATTGNASGYCINGTCGRTAHGTHVPHPPAVDRG